MKYLTTLCALACLSGSFHLVGEELPEFVPPSEIERPSSSPNQVDKNERPPLADQVEAWKTYIITNSTKDLITSLPEAEYRIRAAQWDLIRFMPPASLTQQINAWLIPLHQQDVSVTSLQLETLLAHWINDELLAVTIDRLAQTMSQNARFEAAPNSAAVRARKMGVALKAWYDQGYTTNIALRKEAAQRLVAGLRTLELTNAQAVFALEYHEIAERLDRLLPVLKEVFVLYGVDIDQWLESISVSAETGSPMQNIAAVTLSIPFIGNRYEVDLVYTWMEEWGRWSFGTQP